ncbi:complement C1q-like protein 3 [Cololabis saira]|uniref:complement C1q-like protein 3 n=1 Tax=Cololabis saira TaxID=129043 RepID=UPI002AD323BD|nr:complement C1q-like protein 3 [Cololabis saira]
MMIKIALLILVSGCCRCEQGAVENNDKLNACPGSAGCRDTDIYPISVKVGALEEKMSNMAEKITFLESRLQNAEKQVLELQSLGGTPQVAFSATLRDTGSGDTGPFTTAIPLQYKKVFSNAGNSYNPSTGIFTAMVDGMYFFRFSMFNNLRSTPNSVVCLKKNSELLTSVWDTSGSDGNDMGSNAAVVPLNVGDQVYVELQANRIIYDDGMHYNSFTGFLLFTL